MEDSLVLSELPSAKIVEQVLILVVVEDSLVLTIQLVKMTSSCVLILVVVEDSLVLEKENRKKEFILS